MYIAVIGSHPRSVQERIENTRLTPMSHRNGTVWQEMIDLDAKDWGSRVQDFRRGKDEFLATSHDSPLAHSKGGSFKGLRYFSQTRSTMFTQRCIDMIIQRKLR